VTWQLSTIPTLSEGMAYVLINGVPVIENGKMTVRCQGSVARSRVRAVTRLLQVRGINPHCHPERSEGPAFFSLQETAGSPLRSG